MKKYAVIPARKGSKGLPGKNIKSFHGKPLIAWTIEQAIQSRLFDRVLVSTDGEDIAEISREWGAEVPYLRPDSLSEDGAKTVDAVVDLIQKSGWNDEDCICLLQPTSPLREVSDLIESYQLMLKKQMSPVVSVTPFKLAGAWLMPMGTDGELCVPDAHQTSPNRQESSTCYYPNGALYWTTVSTLLKTSSFLPAGSVGYKMNFWRSADIDTLKDFTMAECLFLDKFELPQPSRKIKRQN
jgi:CMP-N,N'-diacetyllegionaminic acid synthase